MNKIIKKCQEHIKSFCDVDCNIFDIRLKVFEDSQFFCANCNGCDFVTTHLYGCYEAQRWENKYIYYCPKGYIFIAIALPDDIDIINYGVVTGPIIMGSPEDYEKFDKIPNYSTKKVNDLTEILLILFNNLVKSPKIDYGETEKFLNDIYKIMDEETPEKYPILVEKELQKAIVQGDEKLSKELLNKLLGHIFFNSNSNLEMIKSRVLELIILLSRSAIEGGADIDTIFSQNSDYIKEVKNFKSLEKLALWLTGIINRYVSYVFQFNDVKHSDIIFKITAYIKENYMKKLTLDEIANHVYLSKSYLSKIFKDEMNCNLTAYINNIRIEKSKSLLLDEKISIVEIANSIGFDDQSYFTKVFKTNIGISPGKYREKHGNIV